MCLLQAVIVVGATIYIFKNRPIKDVPCFITLQMILLNGFWLFFMPYFVLLMYQMNGEGESAKQTLVMNLLATIGDACLLLHDWLFTYQILEASLLLPNAIDNCNNSAEDFYRLQT